MSNKNEEHNIPKAFPLPITLFKYIKNIKPKTTKKILSERKTNFIKEYLKLNNISISTSCEVKTDLSYKYGHLTLYNSKLAINEYESTKKLNDSSLNSFHVERTLSPFIISKEELISREDILYPIFFIDFNLTTCELIMHKTKQKFRLIILGRNLLENDFDNDDKDYISKYRIVKFKMTSQNPTTFKLVCESINKSIILSNGYKNNIFSINLRKNFCTEYFMANKEFARRGNTGDIILFRGYSTESQFQRMITNVEYDHVGILVKKDNILQVYESTGKEGVKLRPYHEFITYLWYLLYEKMVFRPLLITEERMEEYIKEYNEELNNDENYKRAKTLKDKFYYILNSKVYDFIERTEDKKYSFSKIGFLCNSNMRKNTIRKGYSCSELVAACYFYSGLISSELEASNYLPGNFSRLGRVTFKRGLSLGEEYIIDFSSSS